MAALKDHETGQHKRHGEKLLRIQPNGGFSKKAGKWRPKYQDLGMDQYLLIPFLGGWTSIYQLFWCELQGYKVLTHCHLSSCPGF